MSFATPDPILTTEGMATFAIAALANVYVIFGVDLSEEKKLAVNALITSAWLLGQFIHAALVRKGRAEGSSSR